MKNSRGRGFGASCRAAGELQELLGLLKQQCSAEDYRSYAGRIDTVNDALLNAAVAAHPELTARIEADLKKFGRVR